MVFFPKIFKEKKRKKQEAIDQRNQLVVAGAGTGKTITVIGNIKYLLKAGNTNLVRYWCFRIPRHPQPR